MTQKIANRDDFLPFDLRILGDKFRREGARRFGNNFDGTLNRAFHVVDGCKRVKIDTADRIGDAVNVEKYMLKPCARVLGRRHQNTRMAWFSMAGR